VILADTSIWIDHLRGGARSRSLAERLEANDIACHAFVLGELALGNLGPRRANILNDLALLPTIATVSEPEVRAMVEAQRLFGVGIGWVDAHLVAAALAAHAALWTFDAPLERIATRLGIDQ